MRIVFIACLLASILSYSCKNKSGEQAQGSPPPEIPEALQDEKKPDISFSKGKRGEGNLVEELYDELRSKTPALQQLEESMADAREMKDDSAESFLDYDRKNTRYYDAANGYINTISDSLLKSRIKEQIDRSLANYNNRVSSNRSWIALLERKNVSLTDHFVVLKLVKTLGMIGKYQQLSYPGTKGLEKVNREYDKVIQKIDSLMR